MEDEGELTAHLDDLPQDRQPVALEDPTFGAVASSRVDLPVEADHAILLAQHPDAQEAAARVEGLARVVTGAPGALDASVLA
eukprot:CAMPEP_0204599342 /NCGR_PEP_ID=MMETSP0661-20131031/54772_1 /ASSEMBLY_ACC=CAM_ASM_000606 /TAXON_ID=109239 /ORGANISM="Alexandrium margalefi, Strain AMGDE01CS-322" /LENGTH=81 /DNA_ID=CAMNT_0051610057 /DNA_START=464 /DNA_END=705 /DNA_ORIENTATION=-